MSLLFLFSLVLVVKPLSTRVNILFKWGKGQIFPPPLSFFFKASSSNFYLIRWFFPKPLTNLPSVENLLLIGNDQRGENKGNGFGQTVSSYVIQSVCHTYPFGVSFPFSAVTQIACGLGCLSIGKSR